MAFQADDDSCTSSSSSANRHPPSLHVNGSLLVTLGDFAPLPPTLLQVSDPDSPPEALVFSLAQAPGNGELLLYKVDGRGTEIRELNLGDTFSWAELQDGQVHFRHWRDRARSVWGGPHRRCKVQQLFRFYPAGPVVNVRMAQTH